MSHFPSYSISHWPGCAKAKLQAVSTADRPLCAAVTAAAALLMVGKLYGTLANTSPEELRAWEDSVLTKEDVDRENFRLWVRALTGEKFDSSCLKSEILGLTMDAYQRHAIEGLTCAGGIIGAFMGAGKTMMGVAAAVCFVENARKIRPVTGRCWIVCPLNAMPTWEDARTRELSRYFSEVKIISVDSSHKYTSVRDGDVLIVDEVHRAGSARTRRTKALHKMRSKFALCVCLTGTLVHAGVAPALSIKDLSVPGLALFASTWTAGETFNCLVRKKIGARTVTALERPPEATRPAFLEWLTFGVQLLTPDNHEVKSAFTLPGQALHEITLNDPWPRLEEDVARVANAIFDETGEFPHAQAVVHMLARDGVDKKLDWLAGELSGLEDSVQIVIFANYRASLDEAQKLLVSLGRSYVRVDGDVVGAKRAECQRMFQAGEVSVFLGQIHAASESMNLQCANISITLDVSGSCIDYSQALARTHRRGQVAPCIHIDLVHNRLQARILDRLRSGQDFANSCAEWQDLQRFLHSLSLTPKESL